MRFIFRKSRHTESLFKPGDVVRDTNNENLLMRVSAAGLRSGEEKYGYVTLHDGWLCYVSSETEVSRFVKVDTTLTVDAEI